MRETGRVVGVFDHIHGSDLAQSVAIGASVVYLDDVIDFQENGGSAKLIEDSTEDEFTYSSINESDNTLTGCSGNANVFTVDARAEVVPK